MEVALRKQLAPPKPPALPAASPAPRAVIRHRSRTQQRVLYVRPAPIIHIVHRHGGEHEGERRRTHEGGGFDD